MTQFKQLGRVFISVVAAVLGVCAANADDTTSKSYKNSTIATNIIFLAPPLATRM